jgi:hypothetical protein
LLDGLALLICDGYVAGAPALKVALRAFQDERLSEEDELRWLWVACLIARGLADYAAWDALTARHLELARRAGALGLLPVALTERIPVELFAGRIEVATSLAAEADAVVEATGGHLVSRASIMLANWRGRDAEARALIEAREEDALRRGEGLWILANEWGSVLRYNGLGRYEDALAAAERAAGGPRGLGLWIRDLFELIEAAVRSGHPERARQRPPYRARQGTGLCALQSLQRKADARALHPRTCRSSMSSGVRTDRLRGETRWWRRARPAPPRGICPTLANRRACRDFRSWGEQPWAERRS